ncbi:MAG: GIY-YIG nuclease family protein [Cyclobacteriaceae bacterium]
MEKGGAVYILTNAHHTVFYTGVTSDLIPRIYEHKNKVYPKSFTARYNIQKLIYFETFHSIEEAINREKQIKKYRREKKFNLINQLNPNWRDLYDELE